VQATHDLGGDDHDVWRVEEQAEEWRFTELDRTLFKTKREIAKWTAVWICRWDNSPGLFFDGRLLGGKGDRAFVLTFGFETIIFQVVHVVPADPNYGKTLWTSRDLPWGDILVPIRHPKGSTVSRRASGRSTARSSRYSKPGTFTREPESPQAACRRLTSRSTFLSLDLPQRLPQTRGNRKSLNRDGLEWRERGSNPQPPGCKPGGPNNRKSFDGNNLIAISRRREFSRIYQDFPGIRRVYHRFGAVAEFYAPMRYIKSVPFTSVVVRTRPISMEAASSAGDFADWARLSQASVLRRASV
jgi:hypothetical protein